MKTLNPRSIGQSWRIGGSVALIAASLAIVAGTAVADENPATKLSSLACAIKTTGDARFAGHPVAVVGEPVSAVEELTLDAGTAFQDILERPDGTVYVASAMSVRLPATSGITWQTTPSEFTIAGVTEPLQIGTYPQPDAFVLDIDASDPNTTVARVYFPGDVVDQLDNPTWAGVESYVVPADGTVFRLAFDGVVTDEAAAGMIVDAAGCDAAISTGPSNRADSTETAKLAVGQPVISAKKSSSVPVLTPGAIATWTVEVTAAKDAPDGGAAADAYDVVVVDQVPAGLIPVNDGVPLADGDTTASGGTWDATARTLTFTIPTIARGGTERLTYDTQLADDAAPSETLTNIADVTATSRPGDVAGEMVVSTTATADVDTAPATPAITKTSSVEGTYIGGEITYNVAVTLPGGQGPYYDLSVMDDLPDGLDFGATESVDCTGCATAPTVKELDPSTTDAGTRVGWYLGDLERQDAPRTILFTYTATLAATYGDGRKVALGDTFDNVATLGTNVTDTDGGVAPSTDDPPTYDLHASDDASVAYGRPILAIAKRLGAGEADGRIIPDNNGVQYEVVVTNTGSVPALDVAVTDTPDPRYVRFSPGNLAFDHARTPGEPWLGWKIPGPIDPGQSVTITYTATLPSAITTGMSMKNTATVDSYVDPGGKTTFKGDAPAVLDVPVVAPRVTVDKALVTSLPPAGITTTGADLVYSIRLTNPSEVPVNFSLCDVIPSGWTIVTPVTSPPGITLGGSGNFYGCAISSNGVLVPGYDQTFTYTMRSNRTGTMPTPGDQTNTATLYASAGNVTTVDGVQLGGTDRVTVPAVTPKLTVSKTPDPNDGQGIVSGGDSSYTITISNPSSVAATYVSVNDTLPASLTYPGGFSYQVIGTGTATTTVTETGSASNPRFSISSIAAGDRVRIVLPVHHSGAAAPADRALVNSVSVSAPTMTSVTDTGTLYVIANLKAPALAKSVTPAEAAPGSTVEYTVGVTIPENAGAMYDLTVVDYLPDGISYVGPSVLQCTSGCGPVTGSFVGTDSAAGATAQDDGSQQIAWFFGDILASTPESTWEITFPATVDTVFDGTGSPTAGEYVAAGVPGSDPLTNRAQAFFRATDATTAPTTIPSGPWDGRSSSVTADLKPLTPSVVIDKRVDKARVEVGAALTYDVTVSNVGNGGAYDVVWHDDLAGGVLTNVAFSTSNPSAPTLDSTGATFTIPVLAPNESMTWTYTAETPLSADLDSRSSGSVVDPVQVLNTAQVTEFNSVSGGGSGNVHYTPTTTTDTAKVLVDTPIASLSASISNAGAVCNEVEQGEVWKYVTTAGNKYSREATLTGGIGTGYDPVLRITIPAGAELVAGTLELTIDGRLSPLPPTVTQNPDGSTVYEWNDLPDVPQGKSNYFGVSMSLTATTASAAMASTKHEFWMKDASGSTSRSSNTALGNYDYYARWIPGCFPVPKLVKEPTSPRGTIDRTTPVNVKGGSDYTWNVTVATSVGDLSDVRLTDTLPAGVTYLGGATFTPALAFNETVTPLADGRTKIEFVPTSPMTGLTSYGLTIPTSVGTGITYGTELINSIEMTADTNLIAAGCRPDTLCDTGSVVVVNPSEPSIKKSVDGSKVYRYGEDITYTIDVTLPPGRPFDELTVTDAPNTYFQRNGVNGLAMWMSSFNYVSGYCLSGCTNSGPNATPSAADDIAITTLAKTEINQTGRRSPSSTPQLGWYLQAPGASATRVVNSSSSERVVRLTFTTKTATLTQSLVTNSMINGRDSLYTDQAYTDQARLWYTDNPSVDLAYTSASWASSLSGLSLAGSAEATIVQSHPMVAIGKRCYDPADRSNSQYSTNGSTTGSFRPREVAPGVTNTVCEMTATNISSMPVYGSQMVDTPQAPNATVGAVWQVTNFQVPGSVAVDQQPTAANNYVAKWTISTLAPGESVTVTENIHLDFWTNPTAWGTGVNRYTTNVLANTANWADPQLTLFAPTPNSVTTGAVITRPVITTSKAPVDGTTYHRNTDFAVAGEPFSWEVNLDYWGEQSLDALSIADTLPVGWTYVPGSARLIASAPRQSYDYRTLTGYQVIPLPDADTPTNPVSVPSDTTCDPSEINAGGQEVKWVFDRSTADFDQPWHSNPAAPEVFAPYGSTYLDPQITLGFEEMFDGPYSTFEMPSPPYDVNGFGDMFSMSPYASTWVDGQGAYQTTPGVNDVLLASGGAYDIFDWKRLTLVFDAVPTEAAIACIQEPGQPELYENNVTVQGTRGSNAPQLVASATATAPMIQPVGVNKTPDAGVVADGGVATFDIEVTNYSDSAINDVDVVDTLGGIGAWGGVYAPGSATATNGVTLDERSVVIDGSDTTISWRIGRLEAKTSTTITVSIPVPLNTRDNTPIPNTVTVSSPDMPLPQTDTGHITVRNPQPPPPVSKDMPATARPGDRFNVAVTMTTPAAAAYLDLTEVDTVPDGLTFVGYGDVACSLASGATCPGWDIQKVPAVPNADGSTTLGWFFGDLPSADSDRTYTLNYTVEVARTYRDGTAVGDGAVLTNEVVGYSNDQNKLSDEIGSLPTPSSFDYTSTPATDTTAVALPNLVLDKVASTTGPLLGGEQVTYTLQIRNLGTGPAYNVVVSDTPVGGVSAVTATDHAEWLTKGWTEASPRMKWNIAEIPGNGMVELRYVVTVADDGPALIENGTISLDNSAMIDQYRDGPRRSANSNTIFGGDPIEVSIPYEGAGLAVSKFVGGCEGETSTVLPGSTLDWCVVVTNASDVAAPGVSLVDRLPDEFSYIADSAMVDGAAAEPTITDRSGYAELAWTLDSIGPRQSVTITFSTEVDPAASGSVQNEAIASLLTANGNVSRSAAETALVRDDAVASFAVAGSEISKIPDEQLFEYAGTGGPITWDIVVTNPQTATLNNLEIVDSLPAGLSYVSSTSDYPNWTPGAETVGAAGTGSAGTTPITWTVPSLDPGAKFTIHVVASAPSSVERGDEFVNHVAMTADEIPTPVENQARVRIYGPMIEPTITKSVDERLAVVGERRTYTLTATFAPNQTLYDVAVADLVPNGVDIDRVLSAECTTGCSDGTPTPVRMTNIANSDGTTTHGWWLGTVVSGEAPVEYTFTYTGYIDEFLTDGSTANASGDTFTNQAWVWSNPLPTIDPHGDDPQSPPQPPSSLDCAGCTWEFTSPVVDSTIELVGPVLTLDHDLSCDANAQPGDGVDHCVVGVGSTHTYTVRVRNTGTSTAYDVDISDLLPDGLIGIVASPDNPGTLTHPWSSDEPTLGWRIDSIPVDEEIVLTFTVNVDPSVTPGDVLSAPATVDEYWGAPAAERTPEHIPGVNPPEDVVSVEVVAPLLVLDEDVSCDAQAEPGDGVDTCQVVPGQGVTHTLRVTNTGNGIAYDTLVTSRPGMELIGVELDALPDGVTVEDGWLSSDPLIGWRIDQIPPGATVVLTYRSTVDPAVDLDAVIDTPARIPEYWGAPLDVRTEDTPPLAEPTPDATQLTLVMPELTLDHDIGCDADAEPGDGVDHCTVAPGAEVIGTVRVNNRGTGPSYDTTVRIDIPDGVVDVEVVDLGGGTLITDWTIEDGYLVVRFDGALAPDDPRVIVWRGRVDDSVKPGTVLESPAEITEAYTLPEADRSPDNVAVALPPKDIISVDIKLPMLVIDKKVACDGGASDHACTASVGGTVHYTVKVTNEGPVSVFDPVISDVADSHVVPDTSTIKVTVDGKSRRFTLVDDYDPADRDVRLRVSGEVATGSVVAITYDSKVAGPGRDFDNVATVESAFLVPSKDRPDGAKPYDGAQLSKTGERPSDDAAVSAAVDPTQPLPPIKPPADDVRGTEDNASEKSSESSKTPSALALTGAAVGLIALVGAGAVVFGSGVTVAGGRRRRHSR